MTTRLQQLHDAGQMSQVDCRNINLLTILTKLVIVMVLGTVVMLISLMS
jgi:hypothetical protein